MRMGCPRDSLSHAQLAGLPQRPANPLNYHVLAYFPDLEPRMPGKCSAYDTTSSTGTDFPCCFVSAGARDAAYSIVRANSEAAPGSGLSPGAVRDSIQATVLLVTHAAMAWGASGFFQSSKLGCDADMV